MPVLIATSLTSSDWMIVIGILMAWVVSAAVMARSVQLGSMITSAFGIGSAIYLIMQKYADTSVCSGESTSIFNCDAVNQSVYSSLGPIPVATLGASFFFALLYVSWRSGSDPEKYQGFPRFLLLSGVLSTLASLSMGIISFGIIGQVCPFCVSLYGFSLILLWGGWNATGGTGGNLFRRIRSESGVSDSSMGSAIGAFLLALIVLYNGFKPSEEVTAEVGQVVSNIDLGSSPVSKGQEDAPYTVLEFADFQCPGCGVLHPQMDALVKENEDIRLVFKNFPLTQIHPHAISAAKAGLCAKEQGKFWPMSDLIFENQSVFYETGHEPKSTGEVADSYQFFAVQLQLNTAAFTACMNSDAVSDRVQEDMDLAAKHGVNSTPTLFLHGVCEHEGWVKILNGKAGVEAAIAAHRAGQVPTECGELASDESE